MDLNCKERESVIESYRVVRSAEVCIVNHQIEAWLLADEEALARTLKIREMEEIFSNPEEYHDPKEKLEELFSRYKERKYGEKSDGPRIAQYLRIKKVEEKCESFRNFLRKFADS